jgi:hypothetical protein
VVLAQASRRRSCRRARHRQCSSLRSARWRGLRALTVPPRGVRMGVCVMPASRRVTNSIDEYSVDRRRRVECHRAAAEFQQWKGQPHAECHSWLRCYRDRSIPSSLLHRYVASSSHDKIANKLMERVLGEFPRVFKCVFNLVPFAEARSKLRLSPAASTTVSGLHVLNCATG